MGAARGPRLAYHPFDAQVRRMLWRRPQLGSLERVPQIESSMRSSSIADWIKTSDTGVYVKRLKTLWLIHDDHSGAGHVVI